MIKWHIWKYWEICKKVQKMELKLKIVCFMLKLRTIRNKQLSTLLNIKFYHSILPLFVLANNLLTENINNSSRKKYKKYIFNSQSHHKKWKIVLCQWQCQCHQASVLQVIHLLLLFTEIWKCNNQWKWQDNNNKC